MRPRRRPLCAALGALALTTGTAAAQAPAKVEPARAPGLVVPGTRELLVTFADVPDAATAEARLAGLGRVSSLAPEAGVWRLTPDGPRASARDRVLSRPQVRAAEWPLVRHSMQRAVPPPPLPSVPPVQPFSDAMLNLQWSLTADDWSTEFTGREPRGIIAVLDSGLDLTHPEWAAAQAAGDVVAAHSVIPGRDPDNANDWGRTGHGTHVMGIAAAPADGMGVVGVAPAGPAARVMPVQVADRFGSFGDAQIMDGIRWAVLNGAKVINISAGGTGDTAAFQRTIYWATRRGAVITAAVGNEGDAENELLYPAAYRRVLGVGAQCGPASSTDCPTPFGVARFSQHNRSVDVIAPGVDIVSTVPGRVSDDTLQSGYAYRDGTSMASPYVAGVVALLQAANGNTLTPFQVVRQLKLTADDKGPPGRDDATGWGAVNIRRALTTTVPPDDPAEVNDDIPNMRTTPDLLPQAQPVVVEADLDRYEDPDDVYPVRVRGGQRLRVVVTSASGGIDLYLWRGAARTVQTGELNMRRNLLRYSGARGRRQVAVVRAPRNGRIYVDAYARTAVGPYTMTVSVMP